METKLLSHSSANFVRKNMSARLESLNEQLESVRTQIAAQADAGQPTEALLEREKVLLEQLSNARKLLTESTAKVLRG